jgi:hypothetical protein
MVPPAKIAENIGFGVLGIFHYSAIRRYYGGNAIRGFFVVSHYLVCLEP